MEMKGILARIAYEATLVVLLPPLLFWWSNTVAQSPPGLHSLPIGAGIVMAGILLMALAMWELWRRGGGLPMNAFPPPIHVSSGAYALFPHPIFVGFTVVCAGVSIATGFGVGLWIRIYKSARFLTFEVCEFFRRNCTQSGRTWRARHSYYVSGCWACPSA